MTSTTDVAKRASKTPCSRCCMLWSSLWHFAEARCRAGVRRETTSKTTRLAKRVDDCFRRFRETVANTADRLDVVASGTELLAQALHVCVHRARADAAV